MVLIFKASAVDTITEKKIARKPMGKWNTFEKPWWRNPPITRIIAKVENLIWPPKPIYTGLFALVPQLIFHTDLS